MENTNTDAREAEAINLVASKIQNCKNNTCIFDTIDYVKATDVVQLMLEFAESHPATLDKGGVSDKAEKAAVQYLKIVGNHERPDITKHDFLQGWKACESLSEQPEAKTTEPEHVVKCENCGGRCGLIYGDFHYEADPQPYNNTDYEEALFSEGKVSLTAHKCDDCETVQDIYIN